MAIHLRGGHWTVDTDTIYRVPEQSAMIDKSAQYVL